MIFEPRRIKYVHNQKKLRQLKGENTKAKTLYYGEVGCKIKDSLIMTSKQKESLRLLILRLLRKYKFNSAKIYWRFACNIPKTKKSINSRMGSGVGGLENWIAKLKTESIVFEIGNIDKETSNFNNLLTDFKREIGAWFSPKISWIINEENKITNNNNIK